MESASVVLWMEFNVERCIMVGCFIQPLEEFSGCPGIGLNSNKAAHEYKSRL